MSEGKTLVSLTFDDALDVHLDTAMPILEKYGLRATFYVNVGAPSFTSRQREWAEAAGRGHELGNHTIFHPAVSSKPWVTEGIALDHYSLDRMRNELDVANRWLQAVDGRTRRSFAFPCSNPWLGRQGWPRRLLARLRLDRTRIAGWIDRFGLDFGSRLIDYTPLVREIFPASRCGGIEPGQVPDRVRDHHRVRAIGGDGMGREQLSTTLATARARGNWIVFVFHGVGGGHHMSVDGQDFEDFARLLAEDSGIRVETFLDAVDSMAGSEPRFG